MGQGSSRGSAEPSERRSQRPSPAPRPFARRTDSGRSNLDAHSTPRSSGRFNPFSRLRSDAADAGSSGSGSPRRRTRLSRSNTSISNILGRNRPPQSREPSNRSNPPRLASFFPSSSQQNVRDTSSPRLPRLPMPDLDLSFDDFTEALDADSVVSNPSSRDRQDSERRRNSILERISGSMVPERSGRGMRNSLRRRRSPLQRNEDNAAMLSRLLSVAAAATAASLMGDEHRAGAETRNFMSGDEDGTFESFLQSLQNGRIASALRGNSVAMDEGQGPAGAGQAPLNFFRMFRFGNNSSGSSRTETSSRRPASNRSGESDAQRNGGEGSTNRMVPVIIVGIRSITPANGNSAQQDDNIPPFLDALSGFPAPATSSGESTIDGVLRQPPHNGTRFSHRRRASMGGISALPSNNQGPRHQRSAERPRPWSTLSDSASGPRPPPSTPASSGLSAFSSGATTPTFASPSTTPMAQSAAPSRRESFVRSTTRTSNGLETTAEEPPSPSQQRTARQRRLSESDFTRFGAGSARRNGVVEPDHTPGEGPRSWIIYVLGGSYPEDHPILTTPSLFTDAPTYEDMMLLSTFLGPAKPPVASEDDVASAGGLYTIQAGSSGLVAVSPDSETVTIAAEQRCLVCLCDFEVKEEARQLVKCSHLFHKECIDQWLTTGRNSCPLCRGQGVDEKEQEQSAASSTPGSPANQPQSDEGLSVPLSP